MCCIKYFSELCTIFHLVIYSDICYYIDTRKGDTNVDVNITA